MSWIMNKKSQFAKIFSQAILDMKDTGRLEIFHARKSHQIKKSCRLPDLKKKPLGSKKLAFLFVVLVSGIFISIFVAFFEFIANMYLEKQKSTTTNGDNELNPVEDHVDEFLEALSFEELKKFSKELCKSAPRHPINRI